MPIVYDAAKPAVSSLNFNDRVFEQKPIRVMLQMIGIIGAIEALVMAFFAAALVPALLKARKSAR